MASVFPHLLCHFLLLLPLSTFALTYPNITLGSSLSTSQKNPFWASPSGEFAFGFRSHKGRDLFLLAIWFAKIDIESIVWTANKGKPVWEGSTIELTTNGVLVLKDRNGTEIWKPIDGSRAAYAAMLDTGNFMLGNTDSTIIWESFDQPTDTLLPNQTLNRSNKLLSRKAEEDYSAGRFKLELQGDGNLVLYTIAQLTGDNYDAYWDSRTVGSGSQLVFNLSGDIFLTLSNRTILNLTEEKSVSTREFYQRATLDFDGVLRKYIYQKSPSSDGRWNQSWSVAWSVPSDICKAIRGQLGSGACGYNSYCRMDEDQRPKCECPPAYVPLDPEDTFKGCKQSFAPQSCETKGLTVADGFEMRDMANTDWPDSDYEWFTGMNEDQCRETCLGDCFCAVAIIRGGNCWLKKFPLFNGRMDSTVGGKALIKVGNSSSPLVPPPDDFGRNKKDRDNLILPGSILLGSSVFLNLLVISLVFYGSYYKKPVKTQSNPSIIGMNLRSFTYKELEEATDGFKEELGRGAFSTVYKGVLQLDNRSLVAVKKLEKVVQEVDKEFKTEMSAIGRTNHKNLVQLLGFCDEGSHRLLVYEFMKNGSLATFLFGSSRPDWYRRIQIAFGIARGLAYLHQECSTQIIHCDVKPQNILLDDSLEARISDFGLAKLLKGDQTRTSTGIRGTRGYLAPEWFKNMTITAKVDVYSFGIMLLEIICCRKNVESGMGEEDNEILSDWAYDCCRAGRLDLLVENDEEAKNDDRRLEKFVMVAIWCIQEDPSLRPPMKKVTQMLEGAVEVSMPPDPSSFISSIN